MFPFAGKIQAASLTCLQAMHIIMQFKAEAIY